MAKSKYAHKGKVSPPTGLKKAGKFDKGRRPAPAPVQKVRYPFWQWLGSAFGFRSMAVAVICGLLIYGAMRNNSGYQWVWQSLLKGNWDFMMKHRNTTLEERYQMKLGFDYAFCSYINQNTPEDAVILFPLRKYITEKAGDYQLKSIGAKLWTTYFVYPRKVLYKDEQETNPHYKDVTHVAIIAGHGYEDLDYPVRERTSFTVLPKKAPADPTNEGDNNTSNTTSAKK
ncbi:MAG: hypothetical protein LBT94_05980 [Prevotellaceae bacterium]|jgi:hypothetical protein|nr:hypothetical protein [Prevotellaceae bacterium]